MDFSSTLPYAAATVGIGFGAYLLLSGDSGPTVRLPAPMSLTSQSYIVEGTEKTERIRRNHLCRLFNNGELVATQDGIDTLYKVFQHGLGISRSGPCLGYRPSATSDYSWISYDVVDRRSRHLGSGMVDIGVKRLDNVGIFCQNNPDWVVTEQACNANTFVLVPLYDTLGEEAVQYILNQTRIAVCIVDEAKVTPILQYAKQIKTLKTVVKIGSVTEAEMAAARNSKITLISMEDLEAQGSKANHPANAPASGDLATICYTSGTTGLPKGAMISHGNMASLVAATAMSFNVVEALHADDVHVSYLPLAHMFERVVQAMIFYVGGSVGFFRGDVKTLVNDIQALKPTIFPSVPRLLNRIYDKVMLGVQNASPLKKKLFDAAVASKSAEVAKGIVRNTGLWDRIVFKKVRETLGGRVRFCLTGAAPISPEVLTFLRASFGCFVMEGYGQTECTAAATLTLPGDGEPGHVGTPIPNTEIKLADVPDMNYHAKNDEGEVCFRGPGVFMGYFENEAKTKEALDEDGWLHSGDIGKWTKNGTLKIIDRKKHIFKLAQGEYIAPEKIENVYGRAGCVAQSFVYGDSLEASLVAIIVPDPEAFPSWAKSHGFSGTLSELCANADVNKAVLETITAIGKEGGLKSFEQVRAITLHEEMFSVENGLLTPTFKSKRPQLTKEFKPQIEQMYESLKSK